MVSDKKLNSMKSNGNPRKSDDFSSIPAISEDILALNDLLGEVVERSLDLLDTTEVKLYRSQLTERELFEITSQQTVYRLFPKINFCTCPAFKNQVLPGEEFCCKHYLAAHFARALGKVKVIEKPDKEFRNLLKSLAF
jgi:predicted nucleic acid-binding Zn finger protein